MNCRNIQNRLSEYIDGRLDEKTESVVAAHVSACPGCRRELDELKRLVAALKNDPPATAPADFRFRVRQKLDSRSGLERFLDAVSIPFRFKIPFGFATATAVTVALFFVFQMKQPAPPRMADHAPERQAVHPAPQAGGVGTKGDGLPAGPAEITMPSVETPLLSPAEKTISGTRAPAARNIKKSREMAAAPMETGGASAPAPEPAVPETIQWTLRVSPQEPGRGSEPKAAEPLAKKPERLALSINSDKVVETEKKMGMLEKEDFSEDEKSRGLPLSMDEVIYNVEKTAERLGGRVTSIKQTRHTHPKYFLTILLPGGQVDAFNFELRRMGRFDEGQKIVSGQTKESATLHLTVTGN